MERFVIVMINLELTQAMDKTDLLKQTIDITDLLRNSLQSTLNFIYKYLLDSFLLC